MYSKYGALNEDGSRCKIAQSQARKNIFQHEA
jgi:hypothetical protein